MFLKKMFSKELSNGWKKVNGYLLFANLFLPFLLAIYVVDKRFNVPFLFEFMLVFVFFALALIIILDLTDEGVEKIE